MDNPFAVGDLVHIPAGVFLNKLYANNVTMLAKITSKPTIGIILSRTVGLSYEVFVIGDKYLINKEDMTLYK
jgi:hypothetical protein